MPGLHRKDGRKGGSDNGACLNMTTALITGITGQDGSYLAELLLGKDYTVHGIIRRSSSFNTGRIDHLYEEPHSENRNLHLHYGDLTDAACLARLVAEIRPDEVYHLGAQSHVRVSFEIPEYTADVVALGTLRLLEAVKTHAPAARFYQASSSELFGDSPPPQNEETPFRPRSPYAAAKLHAYWTVVNYREAYGMHCSNGILFNHESPRRGETFVTQKIAKAAERISRSLQQHVYLGNLDAKRDWGFAGDYVEAMWRMCQQEKPDDYVIATGEMHSVREFAEKAFAIVGLDWKEHVRVDERYFRPTEVDALCGDASKAHERLGWKPHVSFDELVKMMVGEAGRWDGA